MSKSDESDLSRINLLDDPKTITNKIKKAKTDVFEGLEDENPERPEARNLLAIYQLMTGYSKVPCCYMNSCVRMTVIRAAPQACDLLDDLPFLEDFACMDKATIEVLAQLGV